MLDATNKLTSFENLSEDSRGREDESIAVRQRLGDGRERH